jgi:hypothetical protein
MNRIPRGKANRILQGGCQYVLPDPEVRGQRCVCVEYTRNKATPASVCYCGHEAYDHALRRGDNDIEEREIRLEKPLKQETGEIKHDLTTRFGELEDHVSKHKAEARSRLKATCYGIERASGNDGSYNLAGFDRGPDFGGVSGFEREGPSSLCHGTCRAGQMPSISVGRRRLSNVM